MRTGRKETDAAGDAFWRRRVRESVARVGTPALVFAEEPLVAQARRLAAALEGVPVRHWWSFKTLPLLPAVAAWRRLGHGVEVVSEWELRAALGAGVPPDEVLVNGPAKHAWLPGIPVKGLRVNFDSLAEVRALAPMVAALEWSVGLRIQTRTETNFEYRGVFTQFGMQKDDLAAARRLLVRSGVAPTVLHFHLRTNIPEARQFREAAQEALACVGSLGWQPRILDLGGGMPPERVESRKGTALDAGFSLASFREVCLQIRAQHRFLEALWMENGRWLAAPTGVLAVRVLDVKADRGVRTLICDGGRTLQAMVATWERHRLFPLKRRSGALVPTLVCGPTCMAFDNLGIHELPGTVRAGDVLIWLDAGAYQLSWETRFSHGLGAVAWTAGAAVEVVRERERYPGAHGGVPRKYRLPATIPAT